MDQGRMEKSFAEFASRPENQHLVQEAQREEVEEKLRTDEKLRFLAFKEKAEAAGFEVVRALEPYLHYPVLRRLLTSFSNGAEGSSLADWACNPRVQAMLSRAKQLLEEGGMQEKELEFLMLQHLKAPSNPSSSDFKEKAQAVATLPTELLVGALNEHLSERSTATKMARSGRPADALCHLQRALAIVNVVRAQQPADQGEIDTNKAATLQAMASAHLDMQQYGAAMSHATQSLTMEEGAAAYALRARALLYRRDFKEAEKDMEKMLVLDPGMHDEVSGMKHEMRELKAKDRTRDAQIWRQAFSRR